jgi:hypothetical protein
MLTDIYDKKVNLPVFLFYLNVLEDEMWLRKKTIFKWSKAVHVLEMIL